MKADNLFRLVIYICFCFFLLPSCDMATSEAPLNNPASAADTVAYSRAEKPLRVLKEYDIIIEKELLYDLYTLEDTYPYRDGERQFQWDKIRTAITDFENEQRRSPRWGLLRNRQNINGAAPIVKDYERNSYNNVSDKYGVERYQSVPLYAQDDLETPYRYGRDGALVKILSDTGQIAVIETVYHEGIWSLPTKYLKGIETPVFNKLIFVDVTNQNIATLEKEEEKWMVRSMNPATTGVRRPPYAHETPLGIFVIQEKKPKMLFLVDGTADIAGYAPHASRFCNGGYVHGVPVNLPRTEEIEYSWTLGTTPRSHMCVRNATSHAKFVYDWAPVEEALIFVIN